MDSEEKTSEIIMTEVVRRMIANEISGRVDVLCYSRFPKALPGLPSWVPDWKSNSIRSYYQINEAAVEENRRDLFLE
ncbi:hypothetical protein B0T21DRAFT_358150 [Apiosordaria backusii]|uniref:Uncharacterized protein n=1 Tax=Apiosordaria backusii TaxID=314023 RepID=A0AA40ESF7_9PEZI|nr:hypothetical protein B0T21DRAFT_358150 [Apiosordaria backusii]